MGRNYPTSQKRKDTGGRGDRTHTTLHKKRAHTRHVVPGGPLYSLSLHPHQQLARELSLLTF